jgi:hypothetical protein
MQSWVMVDDPEEVTPGEGLDVGLGGGGGGADGSIWHTPFAPLAAPVWTPARAAAAVPMPSTATPANAAKTVDPVRPLRRGTAGWDLSCGVNSRFSIIG